MSEATSEGNPSSHGQLGLWDTVSIIVGIVIGSSIFATPTLIFFWTAGPWEALGLWAFCGFLSFVGALCYAELATTYPRYGGDYVYLTRAFDRPMGFLFGWSQLAVILSASTGMMGFIFGEYGAGLVGMNTVDQKAAIKSARETLEKQKAEVEALSEIAQARHPAVVKLNEAKSSLASRESVIETFAAVAGILAVVALTGLNFFGVVLSKWVQNGLVLIKLLGLLLIVGAAFTAPATDAFKVPDDVQRNAPGIPGAMILILYAFGGWNDAAFVAADLRNKRHITWALLLSTLGITVIYLAVNFAYIYAIGYMQARQFNFTLAADVLTKSFTQIGGETFGWFGGKLISLIVMASALGAINGLIYTGSRVYLTLGKEHRVFGLLGQWNATLKAPIYALLAQGFVSILMVVAVGTALGRDGIDLVLVKTSAFLQQINIGTFHPFSWFNLGPMPWAQHFGGFNTLFDGSAPVFWIFFLLTGFSMFALRARDPNIERPFMLRAPFYPVLPMIFCGMCLFGFWSAMSKAGWLSLLGFIPLFLGLPLYWLSGSGGPDKEPAPNVPADRPIQTGDDATDQIPFTRDDDRFRSA